MDKIPEMFGSMVFNDDVMRDRLPKETYRSLHKTIEEGSELDRNVANIVAAAMKDWAIEKGATHFTHWFQPLTGITAEKHDSFIGAKDNGRAVMEFSGKELIRGEPDASSFPSGGLRATFEARGYTAWDPTSFAFIKDDSLCIPTAFCSYGGEVLDKKTPLLRSMELLSEQSRRVLHYFGVDDVTHVSASVGVEQEYFLIDKKLADERKDICFCGRTLFGAKSPKGQELEDHYFGAIRPRVMEFMRALNIELWKLGIYAKTEHNEVAPSQHELAPIFTTANIATDHNQLTMEIMKKTAEQLGMTCLLHEKPFAGVNGSGKHNNWSLCTDTGVNLLDPGRHPEENRCFLLFLSAVIAAVDDYADLLRISVASAGCDHRLGASEAPPAIISMYIGDQLSSILSAIEKGEHYDPVASARMNTGVSVLPDFRRDTTDRNRTSPVAFTGNKFEFRMPGSAASIADINMVINTITGDTLRGFADRLDSAADADAEIEAIIRDTMRAHERILFNGNNYSQEWRDEAQRRGLPNLPTVVDALPHLMDKKNVELFARDSIFTESELHSRYEIQLDNYCKIINIEALCMLEMAKQQIIPAVVGYIKDLAETLAAKKAVGMDVAKDAEYSLCDKLSRLCASFSDRTDALDAVLIASHDCKDTAELAAFTRDNILAAMRELRAVADELETVTAEKYWPFPTYGKLMFSC